MSFTMGLFNQFSGEATQFTSRVTGLVHYKSDRDLVQLGLGYRHTGATDEKLSYKAKPEVNTAPSFISTGNISSSSGGVLMLEGVVAKGPALFLAEYFSANVNALSGTDPHFSYWQVGGGYFITGENRRFNKTTGNPGKLIPKKNFKFRKGTGPGAWEIATRFTRTDGTDAGVQGGEFRRFTIGLNWFTNAHFRYTINYGRGWLDKGGITGNTHMWQFSAQFEL
jgi:phosphate-selective porin OprO/OprP